MGKSEKVEKRCIAPTVRVGGDKGVRILSCWWHGGTSLIRNGPTPQDQRGLDMSLIERPEGRRLLMSEAPL